MEEKTYKAERAIHKVVEAPRSKNTSSVMIRPADSWLDFDWKELWNYRELLYFLTWRDIKVRYKQTIIGVLWAILQPVLTTAIFTVIFSQIARFESAKIPYSLYALSGLLLWLFVNNSITMASNSLISNTNLVTKIYFPRLLVPVAATLASLIDLALGFLLLVGMMIFYGVVPDWRFLLVPVFIFLTILLAVSLGTLFSALNVRFRDVKFALPFFLQVWMFLSPIFYLSDILSEKWRFIFAFNPLTGILDGFRGALFGTDFDWLAISTACASTVLLSVLALFVFKRMEDDFADLI